MTLNEKIGYELRSQRLLKRMTIQQVADQLGKSKNTVSYYELGKINLTINDLIEYCAVVGCDYIEILKKSHWRVYWLANNKIKKLPRYRDRRCIKRFA